MVKIGINGFGRLGRQLLRVILSKCKEKTVADLPKIVMINDANIRPGCMAYMIRNDTFYGKFNGDVVEMSDGVTIDGLKIEVSREANMDKIPWDKCGTEYVIDTSGDNSSCAQASKYMLKGVKRVIVTGCSNIPMFVVGVNHACYTKEMKAISAATPSMNCLTAMLRVLHENFVIEEAMATALHPLNSSDKILDDHSSSDNCRIGRSAIINFSPTDATTKKKFIDRIMPELDGRVDSAAIKLPIPCVGAIDLTVRFKKDAQVDQIKCKVKEASETYLKGILGYTEDELVSSDIIGNTKSCIIDYKSALNLTKCTAKIFGWYDAEYAFATRLFDLTKYIASREDCV